MAKGDHTRIQNQLNNQGNIEQGSQNALMNTLYGQNLGYGNNYNYSTATDLGTFNNLQNQNQNLYNAIASGRTGVGIGSTVPNSGQGGAGYSYTGNNPTSQQDIGQYVQYLSQQPGADPTLASDPNYWIDKIQQTGGLTQDNIGYWNNRSLAGAGDTGGGGGGLNGALSGALGGYQDFAKTGGLSPQDIQDLRARAVSATRAAFQTQQSNLNQNRELQQFSPNYAAASAKMARDMGYGVSDANVNADASIAQLVQQGKLAGLGGMTNVGQINNAAQQANINALMGINSGMTGLYGSTPGLASTFGNQYLQSSGQLLGGQQSQNQIGGQQIQGQLGESQVTGDFANALGNVGGALKLGGGLVAPFLTGGASGVVDPSFMTEGGAASGGANFGSKLGQGLLSFAPGK